MPATLIGITRLSIAPGVISSTMATMHPRTNDIARAAPTNTKGVKSSPALDRY